MPVYMLGQPAVAVSFPYEAYPSQLVYMEAVLAALTAVRRTAALQHRGRTLCSPAHVKAGPLAPTALKHLRRPGRRATTRCLRAPPAPARRCACCALASRGRRATRPVRRRRRPSPVRRALSRRPPLPAPSHTAPPPRSRRRAAGRRRPGCVRIGRRGWGWLSALAPASRRRPGPAQPQPAAAPVSAGPPSCTRRARTARRAPQRP